jgi:hypothetical protein
MQKMYRPSKPRLISCGHCMVVMKRKMRMDTSILEVLMVVKVPKKVSDQVVVTNGN